MAVYKNKIFAITGANGGLGRELSLEYAKNGATIILIGKDPFKLAELHDEILNHNYPQPYIVPIDFRGANHDDYIDIAKLIDEKWGKLDTLIHCAANLGDKYPIEQYKFAKWCEILHINLNSAFLLTQSLLPLLRKNSSKTNLIFTISPEAINPTAFGGAYSVAKAGIKNMAEILKNELENTNIKVSIINPRIMATTLRKKSFPGEKQDNLPKPVEIVPLYNHAIEEEICE